MDNNTQGRGPQQRHNNMNVNTHTPQVPRDGTNENGTSPDVGRQQFNNLFKTQLCKHFQQSKHCAKGQSCHFAHGDNELRKKEDSLPLEVQFKMMNIPYNNFKTQKCKYFFAEGQCRFGKNCTYAHGGDEMRQPYDSLPEIASNFDFTNNPAFQMFNAEAGKNNLLQPKLVLNSKDEMVKNQLAVANQLFSENSSSQHGYDILQQMINLNQITLKHSTDKESPDDVVIQQLQTTNFVSKQREQTATFTGLPSGSTMEQMQAGYGAQQMPMGQQTQQHNGFMQGQARNGLNYMGQGSIGSQQQFQQQTYNDQYGHNGMINQHKMNNNHHGIYQSPQKSTFNGGGSVGLGGLLHYAVDGEESAADQFSSSVWGGNLSSF